jgi:hypothetical protein
LVRVTAAWFGGAARGIRTPDPITTNDENLVSSDFRPYPQIS